MLESLGSCYKQQQNTENSNPVILIAYLIAVVYFKKISCLFHLQKRLELDRKYFSILMKLFMVASVFPIGMNPTSF